MSNEPLCHIQYSLSSFYVYSTSPTSEEPKPRPTIIIGTGLDCSKEGCYHITGITALERGHHVIAYEGPRQPSVLRDQNPGFIHDWEKVITPIVDYFETRPEVDNKRMYQANRYFTRWLFLRTSTGVATFDHRLAATIAIDGIFDVFERLSRFIPPHLNPLLNLEDETAFDKEYEKHRASETPPTTVRWANDQALQAFRTRSLREYYYSTRLMTLKDVIYHVDHPAWVGSASEESFFVTNRKKSALPSVTKRHMRR